MPYVIPPDGHPGVIRERTYTTEGSRWYGDADASRWAYRDVSKSSWSGNKRSGKDEVKHGLDK